jgi:hypothetical protein
MAERQPERSRFRVVVGRSRAERLQPISEQLPLFETSTIAHCTVAIFDARKATEESFRSCLAELRPSWIIDLRSSPRFDFGRLNRRSALSLFSQLKSNYLDLASAAPGHVVDSDDRVEDLLMAGIRDPGPCLGSVVFLLDRKPDPFKLFAATRRVLTLPPDAEWRLAPVMPPEAPEQGRSPTV